tara:strand:+ start:55 stop:480 length:426 start_codon:yes stop_codon:yes gene_type:complete
MLRDEKYLCNFLKRLQFLKENIFVLDSLIQRLYKKKVLMSLNGLSDIDSHMYQSPFYYNRSFQIRTYELKRESQKIKYMALRYKVRNIISDSIHRIVNIFQEISNYQIPHDNILDIKSYLYQNPKFLYDDEDVIQHIRLLF